MRHTLPDELLASMSNQLAQRTGLYFPPERWGDLERGIMAAAQEAGEADGRRYLLRLLSETLYEQHLKTLASHLTIGETYFFRDAKCFEALEQNVLPELIRSRRDSDRRLRIWSTGCCTGEEPYSIAMLLDRLLPDIEQWNITLLATDINPQFLQRAEEGLYGEWSFRGTPGWVRERYFEKRRQGRYAIHPRIKRMVTFSYLNLADDAYPSLANNTNAMDIIFCRNVLMYFTAELAQKVAGNLHRALMDGGWLIISPVEASNTLIERFAPVNLDGTTLYRKAQAGPIQFPHGDAIVAPAASSAPETALPEPQEIPPFIPLPEPAPLPAWNNATAMKQKHPDALCSLARLCANQGKLAEAAEWCARAIAADKLNPQSYYLLAIVRLELGQLEAAEQSLKHVLYLDPNFILAYFTLGNLRLSQNRKSDARRDFGNALRLLRNHPFHEIIAESGGMTAGRMVEIINSVLASLPHAALMRA